MALKPALVWLAVANPVPVAVTSAVAVAVDPPGAYCTLIVQLPPGFTTAPEVQVPPVMENVPPVALVFVTVGAVENVNGPAVTPAAMFLTVIVPVLVVVFAGVLTSDGEGAENISVAPVTWNAPNRVELPLLVSTVTFLGPSPVVLGITQDALTELALGVPLSVQVIPPVMVTAVAPSRSVPVRVTPTVVPRTPAPGVMPVRAALPTGNGIAFVRPRFASGVTTSMVRPPPIDAVAVAVQVPVTVVDDADPNVQLTPVPLTVMAVACSRSTPVSVTGTLELRPIDVGLTEVSEAPFTVNAPATLTFPPAFAMVTV